MMSTTDMKMQANPPNHVPHHEGETFSLERLAAGDVGSYLPGGEKSTFPGPLMSSKIHLKDVVHFIQRKSLECLQHVEEPNQKEAYFFWKLMELWCNQNGTTLLADIATLLFKNYRLLKKLLGDKNQDSWCLPLAKLLCSAEPEDQILDAVVQMGEDLDSKGLTYAAQLCYVVAMEEILESSKFQLIGCDSLPVSQLDMREAIERTEVYEYVCSLTTGIAQPSFQIFKYYHANSLAELGLFDQAFEYCKIIATAIASFPQEISNNTMELTIALSERLHQGKGKEPEWLLNLRQLCLAREPSEMFTHQHPHNEHHVTPWDVFMSQYTLGELLGVGGFGSVRAAVRKADGKQVAIKCVAKRKKEVFITIPGETHRLPLEVALMEMVSKPSRCENVLEMYEWFEMSDCYILILERPTPCTDFFQFLKDNKGRLSEPLAQQMMRQLVQAARHCIECGVLHRDIKAENILINTTTLELKLIDFGCGDLLKDTPYKCYAGTRAYYPPELLCEGEYLGVPATIWSLGVVLFDMVCGDVPFECENDIVERNMQFSPGLSGDCRDLILWCLQRYPPARPTFEEILSHEWFEKPQKVQRPLLESHITSWEVFESLYTPGKILVDGGYRTICEGVRKADGKQVAIKYMEKHQDYKSITIPGETCSLPLEVALMEMVSKPLRCKNVVEMIEWFEMRNCYILVLERPSHCTTVQKFLKHHNSSLSEAMAQKIMRQVIVAAHHCSDAGVLHCDIKAENLLINPDTLEVKLIEFGCGDLLAQTIYTKFNGTWSISPPEWLSKGGYLGHPATMWSLGVLLFNLVCGHLPFHNDDDTVYRKIHFAPGLSEGCQSLIRWCLDQDPESRPTFSEFLRHRWFTGLQNKVQIPAEPPSHILIN